jgi:putative MATE family efflux protein
MQNQKKAALIEGHIGKTLIRLTIPMILGILGMVAFNLIDTFFIGQLGTNELAAISFTFPVVLLIGSLAMGLGMGASAVISRAIGEGDHSKVQRLTTDSLILSVLVVIIFIVIGLLTIDLVFGLLGANQQVMPLIRQYMLIWYPGVVFVVIPMVGNNAIRATGDTKTPSLVMLVAVATNIILDPLLIFGLGPFPELGLTGAAIATTVARGITLVVSLWVLYFRDNMITLSWPAWQVIIDSWRRILYVGLPAAGSNMVVPLGTGVITGLVAIHGAAAVAGFGVASRIDMFALTIVMALSSVLGPFIGQNWGAGKKDRVSVAVTYCLRFSMGWGLLIALLLALAAPFIASLFNDNPAVTGVTVIYLRIVPISYGLLGVVLLSRTAMNVLNKPLQAALLTIIQMFALYIPLAYIGSYLFGVVGIFTAAAAANVVAGVIGYIWLRRILGETEVSSSEYASDLGSVKPVKQESAS